MAPVPAGDATAVAAAAAAEACGAKLTLARRYCAGSPSTSLTLARRPCSDPDAVAEAEAEVRGDGDSIDAIDWALALEMIKVDDGAPAPSGEGEATLMDLRAGGLAAVSSDSGAEDEEDDGDCLPFAYACVSSPAAKCGTLAMLCELWCC